MQFTKLVPFITTKKVEESKMFYTENFGFRVIFNCGWYVTLQSDDGRVEIAFMDPQEKPQSAFSGDGLSYALEAPDVDAVYAALDKEKVVITQPLRDNP